MSNTLLYIGYPKTGSTYLQEWFSKHPAIHYNGKTIGGFGNAWDIEKYAQNPDAHHDYYVLKCSAIGMRGMVDDTVESAYTIQRIYAYQDKLANTLFKLFPEGKILLITRGFSSMLSSAWSEYIVSGGLLSFDEFYKQYSQGIVASYNYDRIVRLFREVFGERNVIALPYELLRDEPLEYLSTLEDRLGISQHFSLTKEKRNASPDAKYLEATLRVSNSLHRLLKPFSYSFQRNVYGYYIHFLNKKKNHAAVKYLSGFIKTGAIVNVSEEKLKPFIGNANVLKSEAVYQPYLKEYLIT